MYRLWIERSLRGEMADAVLVADLSNGTLSAPLAGLISLEETAGTGSIGLIAVAQEARGRGVGTALLAAAHRWMLARGAQQARVVTQADNLPACRLYERAGYRLADVRHVFHFWL
jgi:ribosomal protein S18 acetylase RimI-like enzyme